MAAPTLYVGHNVVKSRKHRSFPKNLPVELSHGRSLYLHAYFGESRQ